jgi:hypothetical protein
MSFSSFQSPVIGHRSSDEPIAEFEPADDRGPTTDD